MPKSFEPVTALPPASPGRMLLTLMRPYRGRVILGALVVLMNALAMMAIPQVLKRMFDHALLVGDRVALAEMAGAMVLLTAVMVVGVIARGQLLRMTGVFMAMDLRLVLWDRLMTLDIDWFESQMAGELVSRIRADTNTLREFVSDYAPMLVRGMLLGVVSLLALLYTSPLLASLLLLATVPLGLIGWRMGKKIRYYKKIQSDRLAEFTSMLTEASGQPVTIRTFGQEGSLRARLLKLMDKLLRTARLDIYSSSTLVAANVSIGFVALTGVVWLGGLQVMDGKMTLGDMTAFLLYLGFVADGVGNMGNFWPAWQGLLGGLERVNEILATVPKIVSPAKPKALPRAKGGRAVGFAGVRYAYPARGEHDVLNGVDLTIKAGQKVALVGPSGAGKSTLLRMMLRLADVREGVVTLDGVDVRAVDLKTLRGQFALVAQDAPLFSGSVRDNVAFGRPDASEREVWAALKTAHADGFVKELPQGLDTAVGERGVQLSGGQRQRLAIARAVLVDAPVLLLDEATSHLDSDSERAVQAALEEAGKGRTVVAIAHRLSTVRDADVIFVLDAGRVVAKGSHRVLMKESELYRGLAALQLRG